MRSSGRQRAASQRAASKRKAEEEADGMDVAEGDSSSGDEPPVERAATRAAPKRGASSRRRSPPKSDSESEGSPPKSAPSAATSTRAAEKKISPASSGLGRRRSARDKVLQNYSSEAYDADMEEEFAALDRGIKAIKKTANHSLLKNALALKKSITHRLKEEERAELDAIDNDIEGFLASPTHERHLDLTGDNIKVIGGGGDNNMIASAIIACLGNASSEIVPPTEPILGYSMSVFPREKKVEVGVEMVDLYYLIESGCAGPLVHAQNVGKSTNLLADAIFLAMCHYADTSPTMCLNAVAALRQCLSGNVTSSEPGDIPLLHNAQLMNAQQRDKKLPSWRPQIEWFTEAFKVLGVMETVCEAINSGDTEALQSTAEPSVNVSGLKRTSKSRPVASGESEEDESANGESRDDGPSPSGERHVASQPEEEHMEEEHGSLWGSFTRCGRLIASGELTAGMTGKDLLVASLKAVGHKPVKLKTYEINQLKTNTKIPQDALLANYLSDENATLQCYIEGQGIENGMTPLEPMRYISRVLASAIQYKSIECTAPQEDALLMFCGRCLLEPLFQPFRPEFNQLLVVLLQRVSEERGVSHVVKLLRSTFRYHRHLLELLIALPSHNEGVRRVRTKVALTFLKPFVSSPELAAQLDRYLEACPVTSATAGGSNQVRGDLLREHALLPPPPLSLMARLLENMKENLRKPLDVPLLLSQIRFADMCIEKSFLKYPEEEHTAIRRIVRAFDAMNGQITSNAAFDLMTSRANLEVTMVYCTIEQFAHKYGISLESS
eukprot:TRINITY_DN3727_c0_g1_i1.p1 TRINITY_DN3727_c0_g1~~TRINITY_DN3727_c0_g1_i1.p1  ORF type:complete len:783 (+),score=163.72 TRINITY_DN3727_c0_g1_i1:825-3173(+)